MRIAKNRKMISKIARTRYNGIKGGMENTPNSIAVKLEEPDELSSPTDKDDGKHSDHKIELFFKAAGNAPILKTRKWKVPANRKIGAINVFMRKFLKIDPNESLFLYVNQSFAPSLDQTVENLYSCFGTDNRLEIHYCKSQAWG